MHSEQLHASADGKKADGAMCLADSECQSNKCVDDQRKGSKKDAGGKCDVDTDCKSGECLSSHVCK